MPSSSAGDKKLRRGWGLLQVLGGIFAGSLVLGVCVPLFIAGQREADLGSARARMTLEAREISNHFREDVRQASDVQVSGDGRALRLVHARPSQRGAHDVLSYQSTPAGLLREVRTGGAIAERSLYAATLREVRFHRSGSSVTAQLDFGHEQYGRTVRYHLNCAATPRSSL
jgi:hypothetical protein